MLKLSEDPNQPITRRAANYSAKMLASTNPIRIIPYNTLGHRCIDRCELVNTGVMVGSVGCIKCEYFLAKSWKEDEVYCGC